MGGGTDGREIWLRTHQLLGASMTLPQTRRLMTFSTLSVDDLLLLIAVPSLGQV